jgi:hypothetical protein
MLRDPTGLVRTSSGFLTHQVVQPTARPVAEPITPSFDIRNVRLATSKPLAELALGKTEAIPQRPYLAAETCLGREGE